MFRMIYAAAIIGLIGGSAGLAGGIEDRGGRLPAGTGFVLLHALQR
ncbi:hypothetical protein ACUN0C_18160 [Faunimonas sp. B44]